MEEWHVYMVRCRDGSLYTGIARDVKRRFSEHQEGLGKTAKYLRGRGPLQLVLQRPVGSLNVALRIERAIKKLPKPEKEKLVARKVRMRQFMARFQEG